MATPSSLSLVPTKRLKIGVFGNTLNPLNKRGASRQFTAIFDILKNHPEVELFVLENRVRYELSPNETLYYFYKFVNGQKVSPTGKKVKEADTGVTRVLEAMFRFLHDTRRFFQRFNDHYRATFPVGFRRLMRPFAWLAVKVFNAITRRVEGLLEHINASMVRQGLSHLTWGEIIWRMFATNSEPFTNDQIDVEIMNINQLDAILNFWWFHSAHDNPAKSLFRPLGKPIIYGWFLDAIPLRVPHWQEGLIPESDFRQHVQAHLNMSDRVVITSTSTKNDATTFFGVDPRRIAYSPCGVFEEDFLPPAPQACDTPHIVLGIDTNVPMIVILGVQEPSKNTTNILKALELMVEDGFTQFQAVLIGAHEGFNPHQKFGYVIDNLRKHVKVTFLGTLDETTKQRIVHGAKLMLYASLWEGFGMPPLEAMAAGIPVVVSDLASLPEVCGTHALYCDPYDPRDIADRAMQFFNMPEADLTQHVAAARSYAHEWLWTKKSVPLLLEDIRSQTHTQQDQPGLQSNAAE
jgi:glycosyltransferase involved in cell wall biosynthesis